MKTFLAFALLAFAPAAGFLRAQSGALVGEKVFAARNITRGDTVWSGGSVSARPDDIIQLAWNIPAAGKCTLSGAWSGVNLDPVNEFELPPQPIGTYTYTLSCPTMQGTAVQTLTLNISANAPGQGGAQITWVYPTADLAVQPNSLITLAWNVINMKPSVQTIKRSINDGLLEDVATVAGSTKQIAWQVPNLTPGSTVYFQAVAMEGTNVVAAASPTIVVSGSAFDNIAPQVTIINPEAGQSVAGITMINTSASDNTAIVGVQFWIDGALYGSEIRQAPYQTNWDTRLYADGIHRLRAVARDPNGNTALHEISVLVNNYGHDLLRITMPSTGQTLNVGQPFIIMWEGPIGEQYGLYVSYGNGPFLPILSRLTGSTFSYVWTPQQPGQIRLRVRMISNGGSITAEAGPFTVAGTSSNAQPTITAADIVNSADPRIGRIITPGAWTSIYGQNLSVSTVWASPPLPTNINGTEVRINGVPVPLLFVSPAQINFQTPPVEGSTARISVVSGGIVSPEVEVAVAPFIPVLYMYVPQGLDTSDPANWKVVVQRTSDGSLVTEEAPLVLSDGRIITLYGSGFGPTSYLVPPGIPSPLSEPPYLINSTVLFRLDGQDMPSDAIKYIGLSPGQIGIFQVNLELPEGLPEGPHEAFLSVNGTTMPFTIWTK